MCYWSLCCLFLLMLIQARVIVFMPVLMLMVLRL